MNCQHCQNELAALLLDTEPPADVQAHLNHCEACTAELQALRATMSLLGQWTAPEPSPFFDTRLHALLREEIAAPPAGFWERMRSRLLFNTSMQLRPIAAGALGLALLVGGGTYAGFNVLHPRPAQVSVTVQELQLLDRNEQAISQMEQLDDNVNNDAGNPAANTQNP